MGIPSLWKRWWRGMSTLCNIFYLDWWEEEGQNYLWIFTLLWCKSRSGLSGSDWHVFFIHTELTVNRKWQPNDHHGFYGPEEQSIPFQFCFISVHAFSYNVVKVTQQCNLTYMNFNLWKKKTTNLGRRYWNFIQHTQICRFFACKWLLESINKS